MLGFVCIGLLTEPGEKTIIFLPLFGSMAGQSHSWIIVQVNLKKLFGMYKCKFSLLRKGCSSKSGGGGGGR